MDVNVIIQKSIDIIVRYYNNDLSGWFDAADEDVLWYGPAKGQFLRGKASVIEAWGKEKTPLTFTLGTIEAVSASTGAGSCEVILTYNVTTHYPSGADIPFYQRLHLTWCERKSRDKDDTIVKIPKILIVNICNPLSQHENDSIYPNHLDRFYPLKTGIDMYKMGRRLKLHGTDKSLKFPISDSILYFESCRNASHSTVYTTDSCFEVTESIVAIEREYPDLFLRIHSSYLINPYYVKEIRRLKVMMSNNKLLPVPEKKFTAIKKKMLEIL